MPTITSVSPTSGPTSGGANGIALASAGTEAGTVQTRTAHSGKNQ